MSEIMSSVLSSKFHRATSSQCEKLHELLEFEEDTAGGIMEVEKIAVAEGATIRDAIAVVRKLADEI